MRLLLGIITIFLITSCGPQDSNSKFEDIPPVRAICGSSQNPACVTQNSGKQIFIGLTASSVDCGTHLLNQDANLPLRNGFDAFGSTTASVNGLYLVGTVNYWVNFGGIQVYDLPVKGHTVCAFVDINSDLRWNPGEPLSQGDLTPGTNEVLVDIWN